MFISPHSISCTKQPVLHIKWRHTTVAWTTMNPVPMLYKLNKGQFVLKENQYQAQSAMWRIAAEAVAPPCILSNHKRENGQSPPGQHWSKDHLMHPKIVPVHPQFAPCPPPMHPRLSLCIPRWSPGRGVLAIKYFRTSATLLFFFPSGANVLNTNLVAFAGFVNFVRF